MKGGVRKRSFYIFILSNFLTLPALGWHFGGIFLSAIGFLVALIIDKLFPTWKFELNWEDIDNALRNIYQFGNNPCDLCFLIGNRKLYVYRDEKGTKNEPTRLAVRIPLVYWLDLYTKDELIEKFKSYRELGMFCQNRGTESYVIFTKSGKRVENCKIILKILFEKAAGGLKQEIYASSIVNSSRNIWAKHSFFS